MPRVAPLSTTWPVTWTWPPRSSTYAIVSPPTSMKLDGRSLLPFLSETQPTDRRNFVMIERMYSRSVVTADGWEYIVRPV